MPNPRQHTGWNSAKSAHTLILIKELAVAFSLQYQFRKKYLKFTFIIEKQMNADAWLLHYLLLTCENRALKHSRGLQSIGINSVLIVCNCNSLNRIDLNQRPLVLSIWRYNIVRCPTETELVSNIIVINIISRCKFLSWDSLCANHHRVEFN